MIWMKLATLIIWVEFLKLDGLDLEGLISDFDLVIFESPYSSKSSPLTTWYHFMGLQYPDTYLGFV